MLIALSRIKSSARPIRNEKDEEKLQQLADSMKEQGRCIVPIKVRSVNGEEFEVVYGNRRLEAARRLQWNEIDCILEDTTDDDALVQELIENLIREDMTPIDTAKGLKRLMDETGFTMREIERRGIMGHEAISRYVKLLDLPEDVQALVGKVGSGGEVEEDKISMKHVQAIEGFSGVPHTSEILKKAAEEHLTADQTRQIARNVSLMGANEATKYLERPGAITSKEETFTEEKEIVPVEAEEFLALIKTFYESGKVLCEAIDNGTIEVSHQTAKSLYNRTGQMYSIWDLVKKTLEKKFGKEVFS